MPEIQINCPRCSEPTLVNIEESVSTQRCERCGMFLYGADTGVRPSSVRRRRRKGWASLTKTLFGKRRVQSIDPDQTIYRRRGIPRWFLPSALICLLAVVVTIWLRIKFARSDSGSPGPTEDLVVQTSLQNKTKVSPLSVPTQAQPDSDPAWSAAVREVAAKFLAAKNVGEMLPHIRQPELHAEAMRKAYGPYSLPLCEEGVMDLLYVPQMEGQKLAMLFFRNRADNLQGLVVVDTGKGLFVDWPTISGCGDMTIAEFLKARPTTPTLLRVVAQKADLYKLDFADNNIYQALRLTSYPSVEVFYGYVPRGTPLFDKIKKAPTVNTQYPDESRDTGQPLTIRAKFREKSTALNQVEIVDILGNGWFVP